MVSRPLHRWVVLEVLGDGDPIQGSVHCDATPDRDFVGWMELAAALEAARREVGDQDPSEAGKGQG